jgi:hypothetical protein
VEPQDTLITESIRRKFSEIETEFDYHFVLNLKSMTDLALQPKSSYDVLKCIIKIGSDDFESLKWLGFSCNDVIPAGTQVFYRVINAENMELVAEELFVNRCGLIIRNLISNIATRVDLQNHFSEINQCSLIADSKLVVIFGFKNMND